MQKSGIIAPHPVEKRFTVRPNEVHCLKILINIETVQNGSNSDSFVGHSGISPGANDVLNRPQSCASLLGQSGEKSERRGHSSVIPILSRVEFDARP